MRLPPTFTDEGIRAALELRRRSPEAKVLARLGEIVTLEIRDEAPFRELLQENREALASLLEAGGFSDVQVERAEVTFELESPEEFATFLEGLHGKVPPLAAIEPLAVRGWLADLFRRGLARASIARKLSSATCGRNIAPSTPIPTRSRPALWSLRLS